MERILVGVDGSPASRGALGWSADLAGRAGLELVVARVFAPSQAEAASDRDEFLVAQRRGLDEWSASVPAGISPRRLLLEGDPPDALLGAARDQHGGSADSASGALPSSSSITPARP